LATVTATTSRTSFGLRLGIVGLMFAAFIPDAHIRNAVLFLLPLFFFCGLIATALARSASLRINREVFRSAFGPRWIAFTMLIGGALTVAGYFAALVIGGLQFSGALKVLSDIFIAIVTVASWLIYPLYALIRPLIANFFQNLNLPPLPPAADPGIKQLTQNSEPLNPLVKLFSDLFPLVCFSGIILLVLILILVRVRARKPIALNENEDRENIDAGDLLANLRAEVQRRLGTFAEVAATLRRFGAQDGLTALTIQRLYARLVALASEAGHPRKPAETPLEYEPRASAAFPAHQRQIAALTQAYVNVHYGELPDDPMAITEAREMLVQLETAVKAAKEK
jgi:hypothetical protein